MYDTFAAAQKASIDEHALALQQYRLEKAAAEAFTVQLRPAPVDPEEEAKRKKREELRQSQLQEAAREEEEKKAAEAAAAKGGKKSQ